MPLSTDVTLLKALKPIFPDRCVACGMPQPDSSLRVGTNAVGWWTYLLWTPGARFTVEVPACWPCRQQMIRQRWVRRVVLVVFAVVGLGVAGSLVGSVKGPWNRWLMMGVALLCLSPYFLWETFWPRPIDLTAHSQTVDYEFLDPSYADEFETLNSDFPSLDDPPGSTGTPP